MGLRGGNGGKKKIYVQLFVPTPVSASELSARTISIDWPPHCLRVFQHSEETTGRNEGRPFYLASFKNSALVALVDKAWTPCTTLNWQSTLPMETRPPLLRGSGSLKRSCYTLLTSFVQGYQNHTWRLSQAFDRTACCNLPLLSFAPLMSLSIV